MRDERTPAGAAPRSINWRHRLTPLVERGDKDIGIKSCKCQEANSASSTVCRSIRSPHERSDMRERHPGFRCAHPGYTFAVLLPLAIGAAEHMRFRWHHH